jgi:uncharacterized protein (DUF2336 family)
MSARERLTQLIDLASDDVPKQRHALAMELADVLLDWPDGYPSHMRSSFALLLEKISPQLDCETRRDLAARLASHSAAPLSLLNELFFDAGRDARDAILARIGLSGIDAAAAGEMIDERVLIKAVRDYPAETFLQTIARLTGVPAAVAARAATDDSGEGLALLCKGAQISRTTFSTIIVLANASPDSVERRLQAWDCVSAEPAARLVQFWRLQRGAGTHQLNDAEAA